MVLDTSAIIAAIAREPDVIRFENATVGATSLEMSAVSVLESKIILHSRHGKAAVEAFDEMLVEARIVIVPFDAEMAQLAFDAFRRYGKGASRRPSGHGLGLPARRDGFSSRRASGAGPAAVRDVRQPAVRGLSEPEISLRQGPDLSRLHRARPPAEIAGQLGIGLKSNGDPPALPGWQ